MKVVRAEPTQDLPEARNAALGQLVRQASSSSLLPYCPLGGRVRVTQTTSPSPLRPLVVGTGQPGQGPFTGSFHFQSAHSLKVVQRRKWRRGEWSLSQERLPHSVHTLSKSSGQHSPIRFPVSFTLATASVSVPSNGHELLFMTNFGQ